MRHTSDATCRVHGQLRCERAANLGLRGISAPDPPRPYGRLGRKQELQSLPRGRPGCGLYFCRRGWLQQHTRERYVCKRQLEPRVCRHTVRLGYGTQRHLHTPWPQLFVVSPGIPLIVDEGATQLQCDNTSNNTINCFDRGRRQHNRSDVVYDNDNVIFIARQRPWP